MIREACEIIKFVNFALWILSQTEARRFEGRSLRRRQPSGLRRSRMRRREVVLAVLLGGATKIWLKRPSTIVNFIISQAFRIQAEKEFPQPQLFLALGLLKTKPLPLSPPEKSNSMPLMNNKLLGSTATRTSSASKILSLTSAFSTKSNL